MTNRKKDHLDLAQKAQRQHQELGDIFYEPLFTTHPDLNSDSNSPKHVYPFLDHKLKMPFWISSMTGGDDSAQKVNSDLARACHHLGIGLGLGSCRVYIEEQNRRNDFHVREHMPQGCLSTNLGIAQVEDYIQSNRWNEVESILRDIQADFLFVHINPLQEWLQPEGDRFQVTPLETLRKLKNVYSGKIGVKEVGQGFGPKSLKALIDLEVDIIELAGSGGTNFTTLERLRTQEAQESDFESIGHHWSEMLVWLNSFYDPSRSFPEIIVSGGVRTPVEAAKISLQADFPHLIGMGYTFLKWQRDGEQRLQEQIKSFYQDYLFALNILDKG